MSAIKKSSWILFFGLLASSTALSEVVSSAQGSAENADLKKSARWRAKMVDLYQTLAEVTTDTVSDQRFNSPGNRARIQKNVKKLADRAHDLADMNLPTDADPTLKILSGLFQDETKRAYTALTSGSRAYARRILGQVSGYCIACHTRNSSGPKFSSLPWEPVSKTLTSLEQGRFYAATRQYDRALDVFQKLVNDPAGPVERPLEWEQAVRYGLAIAVRVTQDPDQARALVERVIGAPKAPYFLKEDAAKWKESIIQWKEELSRKPTTEEGLHSEAIRLIGQAREVQKYPMDRAADVYYLRATSVIHELLQKYPDGRKIQDALMMAGLSYEVLRPISLDDIHEIYYEACIMKAPHSPLSEACYRRYEQSAYQGFTGSAGTMLPSEVKDKLRRLESVAHPQKSSPGVMN